MKPMWHHPNLLKIASPTTIRVRGIHMDIKKITRDIFSALDENRLDIAVSRCARAARILKDYASFALFTRMSLASRDESQRAIIEFMDDQSEEAVKLIHRISLTRWMKLLVVDEDDKTTPTADRQILMVSAAGIAEELTQIEKYIAELVIPDSLDPYDAAALYQSHRDIRLGWRNRIRILNQISARMSFVCHNYASQIETYLVTATQASSFLSKAQAEVDNHFQSRSPSAMAKLQKAASLLASTDTEDAALLLTEVRRAMNAVADALYPPSDGEVVCSDGKTRKLGNDQWLNRLHEYIGISCKASTARRVLKAELEYVGTYAARLNELASKGVHGEVTFNEARQGLVSLYLFLFNLINLTEAEREPIDVEEALVAVAT